MSAKSSSVQGVIKLRQWLGMRMNVNFNRRTLLGVGAAAGLMGIAKDASAASFGNPDAPPQGAVNAAGDPGSLSIPGPHSDALSGQFPSSVSPPPTDVGALPEFWASFNNAQRRIQKGGWARQVTQDSFPISTTIAGVDMRLSAGGVRELHWHVASEWAYVTAGNIRVTVIDPRGRASVDDLAAGDLWFFPAGYPHSLQGLGPDGAEFLLCFDKGDQSEYDTLLVNEWFAHTPPDVLALNFGVSADTFSKIPLTDTYIFQGALPGPLAVDRKAVENPLGPPPDPFVFRLGAAPFTKRTKGGTIKVVDSTTFKASTTIAAALVTVHPGGMREMHWHPNADEWQYYLAGMGQMTVFKTGPKAVTTDFHAGDIGYVPKNLGHYIKNVGTDDLVFLEVFRTAVYEDVSLSAWLTHTPAQMVTAHLDVPAEVIAKWPDDSPGILPA